MSVDHEGLSVASQQAAAFLAHYGARDGLGMAAVMREVDAEVSESARLFAFALANIACSVGSRRRGRPAFVADMQHLAAARAQDRNAARRDDES